MAKTLAPLLAALVALRGQDKPPDKPPDDFVEIKWDVQKEDRFDFKWTYDESYKRVPGQGETVENTDKRDVLGEIFMKEGENGAPGPVVLVVKKVQWSSTTRDHDITITYQDGKKPDAQVKIKGDPRATPQAKEGYKVAANALADVNKKSIEGEFTFYFDPKRTETLIKNNGRNTKPGPSLFDKLFLHAVIPNQLVRIGQTWKEKLDAQVIPTGLTEGTSDIDYKVASATPLVATFKASFQMPIVKPPTVTNQKITGNFQVSQEFVWNRAGYLELSKEDMTFNKKVDASGKDSAFYKEDANASIKQTVSIKKKPPPKTDDKKDEKKPEEKK